MRLTRIGPWAALLPHLVICCACALAYANTLHVPLLFDDHWNIANNPSIRSLLPITKVLKGSEASYISGRPVTNLSFALNYALGGLDVRGYHLVNILIHALNGCLLFLVLGNAPAGAGGRPSKASCPFALACALAWALHPLNTQAVTYLTQRLESLMGLFFLTSFYCALKGLNSDTPKRWHLAAALAFAVGTGAKESIIVCPLLVLIYDAGYKSPGIGKSQASSRFLYGGYAIGATLLMALVFTGKTARHGAVEGQTLAWLQYVLSQPGAVVHYLKLFFWPSGLCFDPGPFFYNAGGPGTAQWFKALYPTVLVGSLMVLAVWRLLKKDWTGFAGCWFFLTLAPASSLVPMQYRIEEHRMYLPSMALVVIVALLGQAVLRRAARLSLFGARPLQVATAAAVTLIVITAGVGTHRRNAVYQSSLSIMLDSAAKAPDNPNALSNICKELIDAGDPDQALDYCRRALALRPDWVNAHANLGILYSGQHRYQEAEKHFEKALALAPDNALILNNYGLALADSGRPESALDYYAGAIRKNPSWPAPYYNLGAALAKAGLFDRAVAQFETTLQRFPDDPLAHTYYGAALAGHGRVAAAIRQHQIAIGLDPGNHTAHNNLGFAYAGLANYQEALKCFQRAAALKPDNVLYRMNTALAYKLTGRWKAAAVEYQGIIQEHPREVPAYLQLAGLLAENGEAQQALAWLRRAEAIDPASPRLQQALARIRSNVRDGQAR